jgi:arylformamidase
MTIHDITLTISNSLVTYPGDPGIQITRVHGIGKDHSSNLTKLDMGAHTGTHVDAPVHFIDGAPASETLDLNILIGPAVVINATKEDSISAKSLGNLNIPEGSERVLFRTRNSAFWKSKPGEFVSDFVAITKDGAEWLVERGIKLVGIDYLSIGPFHQGTPTHKVLLEAGVIPIEGLDLSEIAPGSYFLICLPLKIEGSDGAPSRAVLLEDFSAP